MKVSKKLFVLSVSVLFSAATVQAKHVPGHVSYDTSHMKAETSALTQKSGHHAGNGKYHSREGGKAAVDHTVAAKSVEISKMAQEHGLLGKAKSKNIKDLQQDHKILKLEHKNAKKEGDIETLGEIEDEMADIEAQITVLKVSSAKKPVRTRKAKTKALKLKKVSKKDSSAAHAAHKGK